MPGIIGFNCRIQEARIMDAVLSCLNKLIRHRQILKLGIFIMGLHVIYMYRSILE
jgi:hypothetical protein